MIYVIESIRHHDGTPYEREARRKGQRVDILNLNVGQPLVLAYLDDHNRILETTPVTSVFTRDAQLVITTLNSVYTFGKVAEGGGETGEETDGG